MSGVEADKKVRITEKQQVYEQVWRVLGVLISIMFIVLFNKTYEFQTSPIYRRYDKGSLLELLLAVPLAMAIGAVREMVNRQFHEHMAEQISEERFPLKERRRERASTHCKWLVDIPFYATTSVLGYVILLELPNLPWYLGGQGECRNNYANLLDFKHRSALVTGFYVLQCGHHLHSFVAHLFDRSAEVRAKFYEMFLHHSLSLMLILMSYLNNQVLVGLMVLFLHDASDTFLLIGRLYADRKHRNKYLLNLVYFLGFSGWVLLRMVAFPLCCIYESHHGVTAALAFTDELRSAIWLPGLFMILMMLGLMVMHTFWTYFIFKAFFSFLDKKKVSIARNY